MLHITLHHACSANIWTDANIRRARMARTGVCLQLNIPPSQILVHLVHAQFNVGEPSDCGETYFWLSSTAPPPISKWSVRRLISRFPLLFYFIWWILWIWYCWSTASTQYADKPHTDKINDKPSNHYDAGAVFKILSSQPEKQSKSVKSAFWSLSQGVRDYGEAHYIRI